MKGNRIYGNPEEDWLFNLKPGEYGRNTTGKDWFCRTPNGMLGNLGKHDVVEHEDGTITVSPSILTNGGSDGKSWHGYLERGVWREC